MGHDPTCAGYLETPAFKKDVETFVDGVGRLAKGIVEGLRFLGVLAPSDDAKKDAETPGTDAYRRERAPGSPGWGYTPGLGWHWTPLTPPDGGGQQGSDAGSAAPFGRERTAHDFFRAKGWSEAQTAGLLAAMKGESGFRTDAFTPAGGGQGAQGVMQWRGPRIDAFRRIYGHDPRYGTFGEQLAFTQWELENTEKRAGQPAARHHRTA
ncbi:MAG: phage tail tip lysozyme [Acetobacteraceae bacterium]